MATGPERSKPLHNFSLPCLKWGSQRFLRCVKLSTIAAEPSSLDRRSSRFQSKFGQSQQKQTDPQIPKAPSQNLLYYSKRKSNTQKDDENNIEVVRENLMIDIRAAAKKLKVSILEERVGEVETFTNAKPWNLRTRRAAGKAPNEEERKFDSGSSPMKDGEAVVVTKEKPVTMEKKNERANFSISLSKEVVEEDFWAMVGTRPPRRPKKRPRIVQRQLDSLFPGLWLTEVTAESYKVPDVPE